MASIFISYARPTVERARQIAETLRSEGHVVWMDDQLLAHRPFTDSIEEQLDSADVVLVLWSAPAVASEWVRAEANRARQSGKLVQVSLERCSLPLPFDQFHCISLSSWTGDPQAQSWRAVAASIGAVVHPGASAPTPAPGRRAGRVSQRRNAERRQITALFCNLVDAPALAARLDPEDMLQILDVYQAACDDILAQNGGAVARYTEHGVLAYFGYPQAQEDEAADAVRAAVALRDAVAGLELPHGVVLRSRIGVATGQVVVSELIGGADRRDAGVVGEAPNLALQIEAVAGPDTVAVVETTRRITEGLFTYRDLGATTLPGYPEPVRLFEAGDATGMASRSEARTRQSRTALLGREREMALLQESWELARSGEGQNVLIQGEAGIGKSRLAHELRERAESSGATVISWYCSPNGSETTLQPIAAQLARGSGFDRSDPAEARMAKLAAVLDRFDVRTPEARAVMLDILGLPAEEAGTGSLISPERRKAIALDTLLGMMDQLAEEQPTIFLAEDLHWADPTTLELLDRAVRKSPDHRWMILATARAEFQQSWTSHADLLHLELGRLERRDAVRLCASLGGEAVLPPEVMGRVLDRCDGVPLFIEEITRSVIEDIAAAGPSGGAARVAIPDTLQDSLAARLDRLGPAKQVASLGAAIGRRFSYDLLAAVAPIQAADLRQALRELTKAGLVERSGVPPSSQYLFRHALIRDAAYESLLKRERETLHGRIAAALRELSPDIEDTDPALLAYHLTQGGSPSEAVPLWIRAGQRAASLGSHLEAASHFNTAVGLLKGQPASAARAELELQLLLGQAVSLGAARGYAIPEVGEVLREARVICDGMGAEARVFPVLRNLCNFYITTSDLDAAEDMARRCVEIGEHTGLPEHRIEGAAGLGYILTMRGEFAAARASIDRAVALYREHDGAHLDFQTPQDPKITAMGVLPLVLGAMGLGPEADQAAADLEAHARSLGRPFDLAYAISWQAAFDIAFGNFARALDRAEEAMQICEAKGYDTYVAAATLVIAFARGQLEDPAPAIDMAERGVALMEEVGNRNMLTFHLANLASLHRRNGDPARALETVDRAIAHAERFGDRYYLSPALNLRAAILEDLAGEDPELAIEASRRAYEVATAQGASAFAARARAHQAVENP